MSSQSLHLKCEKQPFLPIFTFWIFAGVLLLFVWFEIERQNDLTCLLIPRSFSLSSLSLLSPVLMLIPGIGIFILDYLIPYKNLLLDETGITHFHKKTQRHMSWGEIVSVDFYPVLIKGFLLFKKYNLVFKLKSEQDEMLIMVTCSSVFKHHPDLEIITIKNMHKKYSSAISADQFKLDQLIDFLNIHLTSEQISKLPSGKRNLLLKLLQKTIFSVYFPIVVLIGVSTWIGFNFVSEGALARYFYCEGLVAHNNGQFNKAIQSLSSAIEYNHNYSKAYHVRGKAYREEIIGKYHDAISDFSKAIELGGSKAYSYFRRGQVYLVQEKFEKALDDFTVVITNILF